MRIGKEEDYDFSKMAEASCSDCIYNEKAAHEMPCCICATGNGDAPYFVSETAVDLIAERIVKKIFEEKGDLK